MKIDTALAQLPIIAILRGLPLEAAVDVADVLVGCGIRAIETPLNSPDAVSSIARMAAAFGDRAAIGAGTVLAPDEVRAVANTGATFVVAPNTDESVIAAALGEGLDPAPGFATPSEAFRALAAGARHLKLFPADAFGPPYLKALKAVLPADAAVIAVGGIDEQSLEAWLEAGVSGFGVGSSLYRATRTLDSVRDAAAELVGKYLALRGQGVTNNRGG